MKNAIMILLIFISQHAAAQKTLAPTESFTIEGHVKQSRSFSLQDLSDLPVVARDSVVITNHLHEKKSTLKNLKGVLLKDVMGKITIDQADPKLLSEYFLVCVASDDYKVVFSWNEIFNNETGGQVLIVTGLDGKNGTLMNNRIALLSPNDKATGRRYVKGLQKIIIERVR